MGLVSEDSQLRQRLWPTLDDSSATPDAEAVLALIRHGVLEDSIAVSMIEICTETGFVKTGVEAAGAMLAEKRLHDEDASLLLDAAFAASRSRRRSVLISRLRSVLGGVDE